MSTPESSIPAAIVNDNDEIDGAEDATDIANPPEGSEEGEVESEEAGTEKTGDEESGTGESGDNNNTAPGESDLQTARRLLEALLFASADPMTERVLANRVQEGINVKSVLKNLQEDYAARGVNLNCMGTSWAFRTAEDLSTILNVETEVSRKMNRAGIETMSVIAYHQPVTRAEIEEIRGVSLSKGTLDLLFEKGWIKPRGRRETPGRPMTWGTTDDFLDHFGLTRIIDLPSLDELKAAGLLESGPALNVYHSHLGHGEGEEADNVDGGHMAENPASLAPFSSQGEEDALAEIDDAPEADEPLDSSEV